MSPVPDTLRESLTEGGHRLTGPRIAVWSVISSREAHLTAEEIAREVQVDDPSVNLSSVYRTLALFSELGLVRESSLDSSGPSHWEMSHPDEQFHMRCRSCGRVEHHTGDLVKSVADHLSTDHEFVVEQVDLLVVGLCADCR
jgi:Fur family ferric uptake transcriptional regulator